MSYFNMQYLKKSIFHRIQFHTEKVWSIWREIEKINFFQIFWKNLCWPLGLVCTFLKFLSHPLALLGYFMVIQEKNPRKIRKNKTENSIFTPTLPGLHIRPTSEKYWELQRNRFEMTQTRLLLRRPKPVPRAAAAYGRQLKIDSE